MKETRSYLALENNNFLWSKWNDQNDALHEIDQILSELEKGIVPSIDLLFAPTGSIQEVSLSSGWGETFLDLAARFDVAYRIAQI